MSSNTLELMSSFLELRTQSVLVNGTMSSPLPIEYGVPQGSVLGPILFSIYINDLPLFLTAICELFADDTALHVNNSKLSNVTASLQENINKLTEWSELNHMCLHPQKTKYMLITTRQKRQNLAYDSSPLYIDGTIVEEAKNHKVLGLTIDNNLSWSDYISTLSNNISKKIFQLSKIKKFLNLHTRKIFFHAYIESLINYASTIWDSASDNILKHLSSLHRRALKLILLKSSTLSISDYKGLDILPLKSKLQYNKAVFMFKILSGRAPPSLSQKFIVKNNRHSLRIVPPRLRIDLFKTSLIYSGSCLWNTILDKFDVNTSLNVIKRKYHLHLMSDLVNKIR